MSHTDWLIVALIVVIVVSDVLKIVADRRHAYWVRRYEEAYRMWHAHDDELTALIDGEVER